jgi:hypothetical protein
MSSSRQTGLKLGTIYPRMDLGTNPDVLGQWARDVEQIGYEWGPPLGHHGTFSWPRTPQRDVLGAFPTS